MDNSWPAAEIFASPPIYAAVLWISSAIVDLRLWHL